MDEVTAAKQAFAELKWIVDEKDIADFIRFSRLMSGAVEPSAIPDYAGAIERAMSDA